MKAVTKTYWLRLDRKTAAAALAMARRYGVSRARLMANAVGYYLRESERAIAPTEKDR